MSKQDKNNRRHGWYSRLFRRWECSKEVARRSKNQALIRLLRVIPLIISAVVSSIITTLKSRWLPFLIALAVLSIYAAIYIFDKREAKRQKMKFFYVPWLTLFVFVGVAAVSNIVHYWRLSTIQKAYRKELEELKSSISEDGNVRSNLNNATVQIGIDFNSDLRFNLLSSWAYENFTNKSFQDSTQLFELSFEAEKRLAKSEKLKSNFWPVYAAACLEANQTPQGEAQFTNNLEKMLHDNFNHKDFLFWNETWLNFITNKIPPNQIPYANEVIGKVHNYYTNALNP